tara:strand:+ start:3295 stop:3540 length:246 start_codon:yes stop_codon:yes gene_type:complete
MVNKKTKTKSKNKTTTKRARNTKGHFKADNPLTPNINEAYESELKEKPNITKNTSKFTTTNIAILAIVIIIIASVVIEVAF